MRSSSILIAIMLAVAMFLSCVVSAEDSNEASKCKNNPNVTDIEQCSLCCAENLFNRFDHKLFLREKSCRCYMDDNEMRANKA